DPDAAIEMHTPFKIAVEYWNLIEGANLIVEVIVRAGDGSVLFHSLSSEDETIGNRNYPRGLYRSVCSVPGCLLNEGSYGIETHFQHGSMSNYTSLTDALVLVVQDTASRGDFIYLGRFIGSIHPRLSWKTALLEPQQALADFSR